MHSYTERFNVNGNTLSINVSSDYPIPGRDVMEHQVVVSGMGGGGFRAKVQGTSGGDVGKLAGTLLRVGASLHPKVGKPDGADVVREKLGAVVETAWAVPLGEQLADDHETLESVEMAIEAYARAKGWVIS